MEEIAKYHIAPAAKQYINKKIIWGIAAFFITVIVSFVLFAISQVDWSAAQGDKLIDINLDQVDYSVMFNNTYINLFMMLNIVLGLFLFDRYLESRKKQFRKEA